MTPVAEGVTDLTPTASPGSYTGPVGKEFNGLSLDTPPCKFQNEDYFSKDPAHNAARALQDLHNYPRSGSLKRSRTDSVGQSLQDNVREMLMAPSGWSENFVRDSRGSRSSIFNESCTQVAMPSPSNHSMGRKRMCCEPTSYSQGGCRPELVALPTLSGPGMWAGILN